MKKGGKTQRENTEEGGGGGGEEKRGRNSRSTSPIAASVAHEHLSLSTVAERQAGRRAPTYIRAPVFVFVGGGVGGQF